MLHSLHHNELLHTSEATSKTLNEIFVRAKSWSLYILVLQFNFSYKKEQDKARLLILETTLYSVYTAAIKLCLEKPLSRVAILQSLISYNNL